MAQSPPSHRVPLKANRVEHTAGDAARRGEEVCGVAPRARFGAGVASVGAFRYCAQCLSVGRRPPASARFAHGRLRVPHTSQVGRGGEAPAHGPGALDLRAHCPTVSFHSGWHLTIIGVMTAQRHAALKALSHRVRGSSAAKDASTDKRRLGRTEHIEAPDRGTSSRAGTSKLHPLPHQSERRKLRRASSIVARRRRRPQL